MYASDRKKNAFICVKPLNRTSENKHEINIHSSKKLRNYTKKKYYMYER